MKKAFLTLAIALASYSSHAQTNTFPSSGNVGIGTTSPATKLTVAGSGIIQNITNFVDQASQLVLNPMATSV